MDRELKQRLVGASVIIALAVIFIPMLFNDSDRNQNQSISIEIPKEPDNLQQKIISIDKENTTPVEVVEELKLQPQIETKEVIIEVVDNTSQDSVDTSSISKEEVKPAVIEPISKKSQEAKIEEKPPAKSHVAKVEINGTNYNYRLKYGVFSQQKNAQQLKAKIIHNGLNAIVEKDAATEMYKVYSNQYASKLSVEKIQQRVQKLKLNIGKTSIENLNKEQAQQAEMLLDTGWIVQIGIFSSLENSIKLRDKIRKKDFLCFVDEITNDKNQKLYRVRIGPYAEHSEAETIKKKIKTKMNLEGLIKPHEKQKVVN